MKITIKEFKSIVRDVIKENKRFVVRETKIKPFGKTWNKLWRAFDSALKTQDLHSLEGVSRSEIDAFADSLLNDVCLSLNITPDDYVTKSARSVVVDELDKIKSPSQNKDFWDAYEKKVRQYFSGLSKREIDNIGSDEIEDIADDILEPLVDQFGLDWDDVVDRARDVVRDTLD